MSLKEYKNKRDLKATPEPAGGKRKRSNKLIFVVQRHKATSLHYDFRLEMDGVLKSWAVPKGPSLNPKDKRLAMMVEDHPADYASFAGIIPENHYGAGIVEIWDRGTYEDISEKDKTKGEKKLLQDLRNGSLKFVLHGKKLKGEFALVKMKGEVKGNAWLLIKHGDDYATDRSYDSEDEIDPGSPINKALKDKKRKSPSKKKIEPGARSKKTEPGKKYLDFISSMLAKTAPAPFSDPGWVFEIKWDGYRAIAETGKHRAIKLYSRNGLSFMEKYAPVADALRTLDLQAVLDGEIVAFDENGRSGFQYLQDYGNGSYSLYYYVFDLLFYRGKDLRDTPLTARKDLLKKILKAGKIIRYSDHIQERGEDFFHAAVEKDLEGIIAKKADSPYLSRRRSDYWLKIKNHHTQEAVIGGFTRPRGSRKHFGALILGLYKNKKLQYAGHTGTGFTEKILQTLADKMGPLIRKTSPFAGDVPVNNPPTWLRPVLVCNIKYTERTKDGIFRHPVFQGLRIDKPAPEIIWDEKESRKDVLSGKKASYRAGKKKMRTNSSAMDTKLLKEKTLTVGKHKIRLTNLDKIFWPEEKLTKGDLIGYYNTMSKYLLPYLKDRPQSLKRNPNGIMDRGFFQKDAGDDVPDWIDTRKIYSESTKQDVDYILCNDKATLLYLNNLGCIELNPWNSRSSGLDHPDYLIIDIDPSEKNTFDEVVDVALAVKQITDQGGAGAYCKTSGASGMHVYIPLNAKYTYEQARSFAELLARLAHDLLPGITTLERSLQKRRKNRIYIDYLQNSRGQTLAAAYCLRPRPGAPVSAPLKWSEVKHGLRPEQFTLFNMPGRMEKEGDLFRGVLKKGIDMQKCIRQLEK